MSCEILKSKRSEQNPRKIVTGSILFWENREYRSRNRSLHPTKSLEFPEEWICRLLKGRSCIFFSRFREGRMSHQLLIQFGGGWATTKKQSKLRALVGVMEARLRISVLLLPRSSRLNMDEGVAKGWKRKNVESFFVFFFFVKFWKEGNNGYWFWIEKYSNYGADWRWFMVMRWLFGWAWLNEVLTSVCSGWIIYKRVVGAVIGRKD